MIEFFFDATKFMHRSGCGEWTGVMQSVYQASNFIIFVSYFILSYEVLYVHYKGAAHRLSELKDEMFLFAAFILMCGIGHLMDGVGAFFWPAYNLFAVWHALTAAVSTLTAFRLAIKSISLIEMEELHQDMMDEVHDDTEGS